MNSDFSDFIRFFPIFRLFPTFRLLDSTTLVFSPFGQAAYHAGDYCNIIPLCEKEIKEGGPNKVRFVSSFYQFTLRHVLFDTGRDYSRQPSWC